MNDFTKISTTAPKELDKQATKEACQELKEKIQELQQRLYAQSKKSLLILFQGMDGSGKDGATKQVLSGVNPQGVKVKSFKKPSTEELAHDFLWRIHLNVPEKGMIQVFNRSHYEDVLVTRVLGFTSDEEAKSRFANINAFENLLEQSGTKILKFFLHISIEKQRKTFIERLEDPEKHWKYNPEDWKTRESWDKYQKYYQDVFDSCNEVPWNIIPSDENWYKEFLIATKIYETLSEMNLSYPHLPKELETEKAKYLK